MSIKKTISPATVHPKLTYQYLTGTICPRPIALVSSVDKEGQVNLAPFSYFNVFSSNPPILIFSPCVSSATGKAKDTFYNCEEVSEVVVNLVNYDMVQQMSITSINYEKDINEFTKAGFTAEPSELVQPPRVKEAPVQFECKVKEIIRLGEKGGAGNLILVEVLLMHIDENLFDETNQIDQMALDMVGRMGKSYYCRITKDALFTVPRSAIGTAMGVDNIPNDIRYSTILTGNDIGQLASAAMIPPKEEIAAFTQLPIVQKALQTPDNPTIALHKLAKQYLAKNKILDAWKILLAENA